MAYVSRREMHRVGAPLTAHEARIIAEAKAAGRITVLPPGTAAGLTWAERQFGAARPALRDMAGHVAARDSTLKAYRARLKRERTGSEAGA